MAASRVRPANSVRSWHALSGAGSIAYLQRDLRGGSQAHRKVRASSTLTRAPEHIGRQRVEHPTIVKRVQIP